MDENQARKYLGRKVKVIMDRPLGSKHPEHGFVYQVNYGYIPGTKAADGEELDAYYLGIEESVNEAEGMCIGYIHRKDDDDDKLVVVPEGVELSDEQIMDQVEFQEKWFDSQLIRTRE